MPPVCKYTFAVRAEGAHVNTKAMTGTSARSRTMVFLVCQNYLVYSSLSWVMCVCCIEIREKDKSRDKPFKIKNKNSGTLEVDFEIVKERILPRRFDAQRHHEVGVERLLCISYDNPLC